MVYQSYFPQCQERRMHATDEFVVIYPDVSVMLGPSLPVECAAV